MKNIVIVGYGQLGTEVCKRHVDLNNQVHSFSRSQQTEISSLHHHQTIDLDRLQSPLSLPEHIDCLYYFVPPSDDSATDQRMKHFLSLHQIVSVSHIIYISTSGVYGDSGGDWVNEKTFVKPSTKRGKRRLDAELQLTNLSKPTSTTITILRCSAIYSAKTVSLERIQANYKPVIKAENAPYTNRIHLADLT